MSRLGNEAAAGIGQTRQADLLRSPTRGRAGQTWRPERHSGNSNPTTEPGGDGGIRTLDRALQPYNGLANRRLQPLGHVSSEASYASRRATPQAADAGLPHSARPSSPRGRYVVEVCSWAGRLGPGRDQPPRTSCLGGYGLRSTERGTPVASAPLALTDPCGGELSRTGFS
jgi:hypothetical protein